MKTKTTYYRMSLSLYQPRVLDAREIAHLVGELIADKAENIYTHEDNHLIMCEVPNSSGEVYQMIKDGWAMNSVISR